MSQSRHDWDNRKEGHKSKCSEGQKSRRPEVPMARSSEDQKSRSLKTRSPKARSPDGQKSKCPFYSPKWGGPKVRMARSPNVQKSEGQKSKWPEVRINRSPDSQQDTYLNEYMANATPATPLTSSLLGWCC